MGGREGRATTAEVPAVRKVNNALIGKNANVLGVNHLRPVGSFFILDAAAITQRGALDRKCQNHSKQNVEQKQEKGGTIWS